LFTDSAFVEVWVVYAKPPFGGSALQHIAIYKQHVAIYNYGQVASKDDLTTAL
jgi:hypothetical protein